MKNHVQAARDYYYAHRVQILARRKAFYAKNRERILASIHASKIPCPSCGSAMRKESHLCDACAHTPIYEGTPAERRRAANHVYYRRNAARIMRINAKYRALHPDKIREWRRNGDRRRRALESGAGGSYTETEWLDLCKNYDNRCVCCGKRNPLHQDHVVPLSRGGPNTIDNIQPLCLSCNSRKHNKTIDYRY